MPASVQLPRWHPARWRRQPRRLACLGVMAVLLLAALPAALAAGPLRQVPAVLHVHSTWSSGGLTLDELVARAHAVGVEAVFLADNHLQRFDYGLFPLRNLLRYRVEYPSLLRRGPEAYLEEVRAVNHRQRGVLLFPGTEVIPQYYWSGDLLSGTLTMHNAQKNILALGLDRPRDYRDMPVVGNPSAANWDPSSLWLMSPSALAVPGIWLLRAGRRPPPRPGGYRQRGHPVCTGFGILCLGMATLLLINNYPFRMPPVSAYDPTAGLRPHQAVIDFIASRGGVPVWSLPEARDHQVAKVLGFTVTIRTDPYPSDLLGTDRFAAFGGIYEDTTTFTTPGGGWDRLLGDFLEGRRMAPAWALGEAAYHREGHAGKRFGEVQTVLLADRQEPTALLEALRQGRCYALRRSLERGLRLERFQVILPGQAPGEAGDLLQAHVGEQPEVSAAVLGADGHPIQVEALLVRAGRVVHSLRGRTPITLRWTEPPLAPGAGLFYRLEVRGPSGHQVLSNPIFVRAAAPGKP